MHRIASVDVSVGSKAPVDDCGQQVRFTPPIADLRGPPSDVALGPTGDIGEMKEAAN
jgi:hypothetical protein